MDIKIKEIETIPEFIDAIRIRVDAFITEQGFKPGWEPDENDKTARNFIALVDNKIVATARFRESEPGTIKVERMATKKEHRGKGIGKILLDFMIKEIKKLNPKKVYANCQVQAQEFYEKCGFKKVSEPYDQWGVMHIDMEHQNEQAS